MVFMVRWFRRGLCTKKKLHDNLIGVILAVEHDRKQPTQQHRPQARPWFLRIVGACDEVHHVQYLVAAFEPQSVDSHRDQSQTVPSGCSHRGIQTGQGTNDHSEAAGFCEILHVDR